MGYGGLKMWNVWRIKSKLFLREIQYSGCNDRWEIDSLELVDMIERIKFITYCENFINTVCIFRRNLD